MDPKLIEKISKRVYSKFPEMAGKKPSIKQSKAAATNQENFILTYNATTKDLRGNKIPRLVRVVADLRGRIIKMSTSR